MDGKYDDIINLPHYQSSRRPHMPASERAAQFMPFAALTGYDAAIAEAGRRTEEFREVDESEKAVLDETMHYLQTRGEDRPMITVRHFVPDLLKEGGAYVETTGRFIKANRIKKVLVLENGIEIEIDKITGIQLQ